ncbi:MAG: OsmC family protein [Anaerolineae bacterium]|nr:OsmC family protein [Anaerolineae bacterium]
MKLIVQHVDGLRFLATAGSNTVVVDAAPEDGGAGTALSAPQLFAAAIGACVCEFVTNSYRLHDIPFERLGVEIACEELERPRRLGAVDVQVRIEPQPPEEMQRRLLGVARHATLVNTLARAPEVNIRFTGE